MIDLSYKPLGMFTLFLPESEAGRAAWDDIAAQTEGTGKVLTLHAPSVIAQLRKAGYTVRIAKVTPLSEDDVIALLDELAI